MKNLIIPEDLFIKGLQCIGELNELIGMYYLAHTEIDFYNHIETYQMARDLKLIDTAIERIKINEKIEFNTENLDEINFFELQETLKIYSIPEIIKLYFTAHVGRELNDPVLSDIITLFAHDLQKDIEDKKLIISLYKPKTINNSKDNTYLKELFQLVKSIHRSIDVQLNSYLN